MNEQHVRWYTRHLSRDFEMLVFGHAGYPVVLFPTSLGRYYQNKDFGLVGSVAGDDTVLCVFKDTATARRFQRHLDQLSGRSGGAQ